MLNFALVRRRATRIVIALAIVTAACGSGGPDAAADAEVRAASRAWDEAHNAGNVSALGPLYADNAVSMPNGRPVIEGRADIEADFRAFFSESTASHKTTIVSLEIVGDVAIERGAYDLSIAPKAGGRPTSEHGKHIVIRRRFPDGWKIQWEIWNTDTAPESAPAARVSHARDLLASPPT